MQRFDRHERIVMHRRKRERAHNNRPRPWFWIGQGAAVLILAVFLSVAGVVGAVAATGFGIYTFYAQQLPDASVIEQQQDDFETVRIYDRTGQHLLYESVDPRPFRGDRRYMPLSEMSPVGVQAAVALEDRNFWDNPGVNVRGLFRAFASNLQGGACRVARPSPSS
jgi:membrane peptidoglycan carboxypeptidase